MTMNLHNFLDQPLCPALFKYSWLFNIPASLLADSTMSALSFCGAWAAVQMLATAASCLTHPRSQNSMQIALWLTRATLEPNTSWDSIMYSMCREPCVWSESILQTWLSPKWAKQHTMISHCIYLGEDSGALELAPSVIGFWSADYDCKT